MLYYFYLFAQTDLGRSFNRHSRTSKSLFANKYLIIIVLGIAAVWAGLYYWDKWKKNNTVANNATDDLFEELCDSHRLEKSERKLLAKASNHHNLDDPALLFVSPEMFSNWPASLASEEKHFASLAKKLFGEHKE